MVNSRNERIDPTLANILDERARNLKVSKVIASRDAGILIKTHFPDFTSKDVVAEIKKKRKLNDFFQI